MGNIILNNQQIAHKIERIAFQILEANVNEKEIIVAGIQGGGLLLAQKIITVLHKISDKNILLCEITMDKKNPIKSEIKTSLKAEQYQNKSVVIVDDVLFSGRTLIYGVHHFLNVPLKQLKTVVLVNRNFKKFPVKADFKGISLSTSMKESVEVIFSTKGDQVQLAD
ncbi:MAG: phosphoribosyltransferase [Flavobacteriaceae bacterium]|jgi:pyrimidine operon attenuation protein/uracil phosphoribosyltransferase|nr:phosphoribosyltransferase [Flavobacteriaceae bacterium]NVJ72902.1 phosphoribosyltransferase [Flavobacteriaceae bacterium]